MHGQNKSSVVRSPAGHFNKNYAFQCTKRLILLRDELYSVGEHDGRSCFFNLERCSTAVPLEYCIQSAKATRTNDRQRGTVIGVWSVIDHAHKAIHVIRAGEYDSKCRVNFVNRAETLALRVVQRDGTGVFLIAMKGAFGNA